MSNTTDKKPRTAEEVAAEAEHKSKVFVAKTLARAECDRARRAMHLCTYDDALKHARAFVLQLETLVALHKPTTEAQPDAVANGASQETAS